MPAARKKTGTRRTGRASVVAHESSIADSSAELAAMKAEAEVLQSKLRDLGSPRVLRDMAERYGIRTPRAFGVPVGAIRALANEVRAAHGGPDHPLAAALWDVAWYEARMLACFVDDPDLVTVAQMDRWCRDFDNWGICDTACFHLFDRSAPAWGRVKAWSTRKAEFEKRAAFALLASLALHDKKAEDRLFAEALPLVERGAADDRNFVKKAVSWALRSIGGRGPALHAEAVEVATRLADGPRGSAERWVGADALRGLKSAAVVRRVAKSKLKKAAESR